MTTVQHLLRTKEHSTVHTIAPQSTVYEALQMMATHAIGALPVVQAGQLVGIFTERDYARKGILQGRASKNTHVRELMTDTVVSVTPEQTVERCMWLMTKQHIRHLLVLDKNRVVGMVSIGDVVKNLLAEQAHTIERLVTPGGDLLDQ